ncbi:Rpn family recombination-promoting nuclease/putative transposase, partial [Pollutimonas bauzanensis]
MNLYDQYYRKLFSSPHMVRALFQGILPPALLAMLDLDTLEPLPTNYVSGWQRDRRGDLVWRVRRRDGIMLYLLILLEHQSDQDRIMGIRIMGYSALLYEDITMRDLVQP